MGVGKKPTKSNIKVVKKVEKVGVDERIKSIFTECQLGNHNNQSLIVAMTKIYDSMKPSKFREDFIYCLKRFMIVFKREPAVERGLDFISKFVSSLKVTKNKNTNDEDDDDEDMHPFLQDLFHFLLENHDVRSKATRFRVCQLINKILADLGENANIDDGLYQQIYDNMLIRLCDICHVVRTHAVLALKRLQDPDNSECPIIKSYLMLLSQDKNYEVRRAVLSCVAVCMNTLEHILKRTRDKNHFVRKLAYKIISGNVNVKILTIAQRMVLVKRGMKDINEQVRDVCLNVMVMSWYRIMDQDIYRLLSILFCQNYVEECTDLLLNLFFNKKSTEQLVEEFNLLDESHCIPSESLTCENVLYWQVLCQHLHKLGAKEEAHLDMITPTCIDFIKYLKQLLATTKRGQATTTEEIVKEKQGEFVLYQVVIIMSYLDTSDQAGRQALSDVIKTALIDSTMPKKIMEVLIKQFLSMHADINQLVSKLSEIISDILQMRYNSDGVMEQTMEVDAEKIKKLEMEMARINVELMHLQDVLEEHIKNQDFVGAAQVKETISKLKEDKAKLTEEMSAQGSIDLNGHDDEEENERSVLSQAVLDPVKMKRVLFIVAEVLKYPKINKLMPSILTIIDNIVLPGLTSYHSDVRNLGVKVLGQCCLRDVNKAQQYLPLFFQVLAVDRETVQVTAMKAIFDLMLFWGLPAIVKDKKEASDMHEEEEDDDDDVFRVAKLFGGDEKTDDDDNSASQILDNLLKYLDSEVEEIRTVCSVAFSRMLYSNRITSPSLISRLFLIWYNPLTEDDAQLRSQLASFFINFSIKSKANQEIIGETFLPTLRVLLNAPPSSPLSQVQPSNVAELLINLSNPQNLQKNIRPSHDEVLLDKTPHDDIAVSLCNEILSNPLDVKKVKVFSRALVLLSVSPSNRDVLKSLRVLAKKIIKVVKDKMCLITMVKFSKSIKKMLMDLNKIDADLSQLDDTLIAADNFEHTDADNDHHISEPSQSMSEDNLLSSNSKSSTFQPTKNLKRGVSQDLPNLKSLSLSSKDIVIDEEDSSDAFSSPVKSKKAKQAPEAKLSNKENLILKRKSGSTSNKNCNKRKLETDDDDNEEEDDNENDDDDEEDKNDRSDDDDESNDENLIDDDDLIFSSSDED